LGEEVVEELFNREREEVGLDNVEFERFNLEVDEKVNEEQDEGFKILFDEILNEE
jgi:hypothetical protein